MQAGKVYLVGAGPGDIGLITVKGLEAIQKADVILYDRLANPKLLDFAKQDAELIYCGKLPNRHILRQEAINALLVEKASEGKLVTRLKGGDPSVFGRVGEEAEALADAGIQYDIVPGITSGIAAAAYAGIPVTHREYGNSFAVVTAHDKSKNGQPSIDWEGLVRGIDTVAFYMGVANLPYICENMIKHGKSPQTPVILIQWGTFGRQKTLQGTLETIAELVQREKFTNPAITLVGDIVAIREKIQWFEKKPLYGRQILLARTTEGNSTLAKQLSDEGADVIEFPKWKQTKTSIEASKLATVVDYDKILFTSPNSVQHFFEQLLDAQLDIRSIKAELYGVSSKSVAALKGKGLLAKLAVDMEKQGSLLIVGDDTIEQNEIYYTYEYGTHDTLITSKKQVDEAYFPIFLRMLEEAAIDTIVLPSSASVSTLYEGLKGCGIDKNDFFNNKKVICMGQQTRMMAELNQVSISTTLAYPTAATLIECLTTTREAQLVSLS
ncbi:uroporphyrinogen-III C-methyltransferase [Bacillus sp. HMF5848]|nr:uroporphyrinogen-III C-methyltransferase [Bacillus sp. HMF5848]